MVFVWAPLPKRPISPALPYPITFGYGKIQGVPHKSKSTAQVSNVTSDSPAWFVSGVEAALLAPTSMNQQKFMLTLSGNQVTAKAGMGINTKVDLGIVKYHFEVGAGTENFQWNENRPISGFSANRLFL